MKKHHLSILAFALLLAAATSSLRAADPASMEVTENPALLVTPGIKAADLTVYGAKLGDSIDKIDPRAGVVKKPAENAPEIIYCTGRDVSYLVYKDKIVQIILNETLLTHLPPFDPTRLQVALGKADQIETVTDTPATLLSFLTLQLQFTIAGTTPLRSRITSITLYAP
jgi:hypothetical protein